MSNWVFRVSVAAVVVLGLASLMSLAGQGASVSSSASKPDAGKSSSSRPGVTISDRTMKDILDAEEAQKEKLRTARAPMKWTPGTYTDPNGVAWKYSVGQPPTVKPGTKYPLFLGNTGSTLTLADSQAQYPCYVLSCYIPDEVFSTTKKMPDWTMVSASGWKGVIDKAIADNPAIDPSRVYIEGCSRIGIVAWLTAYNYPDTIAATIPMATGYGLRRARLIASRKIGIWMFQGMLDPLVKSNSDPASLPAGIQKYLYDAGYHDVMYSEYTNGDHHEFGFTDSLSNPDWNDFTRLRKWMFDQKKSSAPWPVISSPIGAVATVGKPFTYTITATNQPKTFRAWQTGTRDDIDPATNEPREVLPNSLSLDHKTGVLSGTPAEAGRVFIRLTAANDKGEGFTTLQLVVKDK